MRLDRIPPRDTDASIEYLRAASTVTDLVLSWGKKRMVRTFGEKRQPSTASPPTAKPRQMTVVCLAKQFSSKYPVSTMIHERLYENIPSEIYFASLKFCGSFLTLYAKKPHRPDNRQL